MNLMPAWETYQNLPGKKNRRNYVRKKEGRKEGKKKKKTETAGRLEWVTAEDSTGPPQRALESLQDHHQ